MIHPALQSKTKPIGSLPRRFSPKFARLMREIRRSRPSLADGILHEIQAAQAAERRANRLLAQYRIGKRRVPILRFPQR